MSPTSMKDHLIAHLSDIIGQLSRGELVALSASAGHEYPYMAVHQRLDAPMYRVKTGPAVLTLELKMEVVPKKEESCKY